MTWLRGLLVVHPTLAVRLHLISWLQHAWHHLGVMFPIPVPCYCGKTIKGILTITRWPYCYEVDMAVLNVVHPLVVVSPVPRPTVSAAVSWCAPDLLCSIIPISWLYRASCTQAIAGPVACHWTLPGAPLDVPSCCPLMVSVQGL